MKGCSAFSTISSRMSQENSVTNGNGGTSLSPEKLEYYSSLLKQNNIDFEVIDLKYSKIEIYSDYLNNIKFKNIINTLRNIDINDISFKEAFLILEKLSEEAKNIQ